jgi:TRAP-type C4-dicarboxylate transport system substrate-binding protein
MIRTVLLPNVSLWGCLWQSTLIALLGLMGSLLLRRRPARAHQLLLLAVLAAVLVPAPSGVVRHFHLGLFTQRATVPERMEPQAPGTIATGALVGVSATEVPASPRALSSAAPRTSSPAAPRTSSSAAPLIHTSTGASRVAWRTIALWIWMAATSILLARLFFAFTVGVRLSRRARPLTRGSVVQAMSLAQARLGVHQDLQVRTDAGVRSPVIWCWGRRPVLLLPEEVSSSNGGIDWVGVISHELAHWKRRDHISGLLAELAVCALPWNLLLWLSKRRLVSLTEQACDDWVIASGQPAEDYAEALLDFKPQNRMAFVPAVVHGKRSIASRVHRILNNACGDPRPGAKWALGVSIVVACVAVGLAFAQTRVAEPTRQDANKPEAGSQAGPEAESKSVPRPIELRYSTFFAPESSDGQVATAALWAEEIERRTNGRVKIKIFANESLTSAGQCYEGVVKGIADIGMSYFFYTRERFPLLAGLDLPLGYPNATVATQIAMELTEKYRPAEVADTHVLYVQAPGPSVLASKRPVRTLDDIKGMRICATADLPSKIASALRATPLNVPSDAVYEALKWDVADGTLWRMETLQRLRQGGLINSITEGPALGHTMVLFVTMNLKKWWSLPPDIQEVFTKVSREWALKHAQAWDRANAAGRAFVERLNREVISLSPEEQQRWKQAVRPILDAYVKAARDKGLPGEQFLKDAQDLIAWYAEPADQTASQPAGAAKPEPASQAAPEAESKPAAQPIEFRYSTFFASPSANRQVATATLWARTIENRTNGRVKVTIFDNGSLTPAEQCYEGVVKGISDIGMSYFFYTRERFPLLAGLDLPLGYPNAAVATRVATELTEKYRPAELADTHLLYVQAPGPSVLASKKPVRTLDDIKGMRICATADVQYKIASALGATPVDVPWSAAYEALKSGAVDGTLCRMELLQRVRQGEVINSITQTPALGNTMVLFVTMNLKKWQSLPPDIQQVFTDVSQEWAAKHAQAWDQADAAGRAFIEDLRREAISLLPRGAFIEDLHRVISLSPEEQQRWKQAVRPILDAYVKATQDKGLPGEQFLKDAQDLIAEYYQPAGR